MSGAGAGGSGAGGGAGGAVPPNPPPVNTGGGGGGGHGFFDNDDLSGECFILGELGEQEESLPYRRIYVPQGMQVAQTEFRRVSYTTQDVDKIVRLNAFDVFNEDIKVSANEASRIAYLRYLALREGHVSPSFTLAAHNVAYNECVHDTNNIANQYATPGDGMTPDTFNIAGNLTVAYRRDLRTNYGNILCTVAYMFRVRGHHWLASMDDEYKDLWNKCLQKAEDPGLSWEKVAHHAIHAIFPDMLDALWQQMANDGTCAGALVKRLDSPPAGVAAVRTIYAGAMDLKMAMLTIHDTFKDQYDALERLVAFLVNNRWAGSINRKFYVATALKVDEQAYAAIAAGVMAYLESFFPVSPLIKFQSLKRVANNARITSALIARSIPTVATRK